MKLFMVSDFHFGKHSLDSDKWLKMMLSYFYEFFIPTIKKYAKKDDKLIILGDIFDNRNNINIKVLVAVVKLFEDLGKIIEVHTILGNHDMWAMSDPEINSVCSIRNIPGIKVYQEPEVMNFDGKDVLMFPWVHGKNEEKTILEKHNGCDILICHSDLNGCRTQLNPTRPINRDILDINDFTGYKHVYSGHIHITQQIKHFTFVGSPYHLDRNDISNRKGIWVYDTKKDTDIFLENSFSPEYKKIKIYKESDLNIDQNILDKDHVDLEISQELLANAPHVRLEIEKLTNKYNINNVDFINDITEEPEITVIKKDVSNKTIKELSLDWVEELSFTEKSDMFTEIELKDAMKEVIEKCHNTYTASKK